MSTAARFKEVIKHIAVCGVCGGPRHSGGGSVCKPCYLKPDVRRTYLNQGKTKVLLFEPSYSVLTKIEVKPRIIRVKPAPSVSRIEIEAMLNAPENLWHPGLYKAPRFCSARGPYKAKELAARRVALAYPYVIKPHDEHGELLAVNALIPAWLPGREDVCQEIMIALWEKRITLDQLKANRANVSAFIRSFKRNNFEASGYAISLDQPMYDGRSWHDVLTSDQP